MRHCFALAAAALLLAAPAAAQITYDGTITESEWFEIDDDTGTPFNGFGDGHQINALYADIADDGSSLSLGIAGGLDGNDAAGNRNYLVVLLDTRAGGYGDGSFGRADGPDFGNGITNFNSASNFDTGFEADYALQIGCSFTDCFASLYTLSGSVTGGGGGPNTFIGSASATADFGVDSDPGDLNSRTKGFEIRLTASGDGSGALLELDRQSFQAFAFIISGSGFLSNQFITPVGLSSTGGDNYGFAAVNFDTEPTDPVVYAEQVFADQRTRAFRDRGYRMLASPTPAMTVADLAAQDLVRFRGTGEAVEVFTDYNTTGFVPSPTASTALGVGEGYLWYLYDGRTPSSQTVGDPQSRPLAYTFESGGPMATGTVTNTHALTDTDPGTAPDDFYLAGNPFVDGLNLNAITSPDGTIADAVYVYDPFTRAYQSFSRAAGDVVAPLQGFMLEIEEAPLGSTVTWEIPQTARASGGTFIGKVAERATLVLERQTEDGWEPAESLALARGRALDTGKPVVAPDGSPLATYLTGETARRGGLGQVGLEASGETVALALRAEAGTYRWTLDGDLGDLNVALRDAWTGETVDLTAAHTFDASGDLAGRFTLVVSPEGEAAPEASGVGAVYPNPAAGVARVLVDLPSRQSVRVEVLDLLGRVVAVAFEGEAQTEAIALDTRSLAPGAYLVRVSSEMAQDVRRLTVTR